jgi:hypothetical protein
MNHKAIYNTHPTVVTIDDNAGAFDADGNLVSINESLVLAEITRLQAEYDAKEYARKRQIEYPALGEQLDMLWHAIDSGTLDKDSDFYTILKAVKDKYPKSAE